MDKLKCEQCVCRNSTLNKGSLTVCDICYDMDRRLEDSNYHYVSKIDCPDNCGKCMYLGNKENGSYSCKASKHINSYTNHVCTLYIRKNYITKNTPKWCPMKTENTAL